MAETQLTVYPDLNLPILPNRPFFYANFVQTLDGKVDVQGPDRAQYWPIGSPLDYTTLLELRAQADILIHGRYTAMVHPTVQSLAKPEFQARRQALGKSAELPYAVISSHPDQALLDQLNAKSILITDETAALPAHQLNLLRLGAEKVDLTLLSAYLWSQGYRQVLVEGGPTLLAEFLKCKMIDQLFITIAPKLFGSATGQTLTLVEGQLFSPETVINCELLSLQAVQNEVYVRYAVCH